MYSIDAAALPLKQRSRRRRFVAVDIENVVGGAVSDSTVACAAWQHIAEVIALENHEQVVVGAGPSSLLAAGLTRPTARLVLGRGLSGADLALVAVLRSERIAERFDEVLIVSGDGAFADVSAELAKNGVDVTVVARKGTLSARLRLAAGSVVYLPETTPSLGRAA